MKYKESLLNEIYICIKHLNLTYSDIMNMPTYERRFFLITLLNEVTEANEKNENTNTITRTGKHTRTIRKSI